MSFDLDPDGNIITRSVIGWTNAPVAGMFVLARLEHVGSEDQLRASLVGANPPDAVQLTFTPQQALEFADSLTRMANIILQQQIPAARHQN